MKYAVPIIIIFLFSSCAVSYHPLEMNKLKSLPLKESGEVRYVAKYGILYDSRNKKYGKKEHKKGIKLLAVKIENNTGRNISFKKDIKIYEGEKILLPVEPTIAYELLKQKPYNHLLWGLLWGYIYKCDYNGDCQVIPLPVGLVAGSCNTLVASSSNKNFLSELNKYNLLNREIKNGETVTGIICVSTKLAAPVIITVE